MPPQHLRKWRRALDHVDGIKIGLTATPCVTQDLPDVDEEDRVAVRDTLRFFEVPHPTYTYTMKEAIADGHLVPYEIYRAMTVRTAATDGLPSRATRSIGMLSMSDTERVRNLVR